MSTQIEIYSQEMNQQLANPQVRKALLETTFKGLDELNMKKAIVEGMIRGFNFKDFLEKNIYAVKFGNAYSLVTSIDYARKLGARSGVCGITEPIYEMDGNTIISCAVTVKKVVNGIVGEFTAKVYFSEYTTGRNLWATKPRTMIAKVAEMHALRKACPEELSQAYTEEEIVKESFVSAGPEVSDDLKEKIENAKTVSELKTIWDENKGLGKEFGRMVSEKRKLIEEKNENS